jgi:GH24 family phage-related lysozyme (muramidase)
MPIPKTSSTPVSSVEEVKRIIREAPVKLTSTGPETTGIEADASTISESMVDEALTAGEQTQTATNIDDLHVSPTGILSILHYELFYPYEYFDYKGYSIGYGHLQTQSDHERFSNGLTEEQAYGLFLQDIVRYENIVKRKVKVKLTQAQFDALVMFSYNVGSPGSGMTSALNKNDFDAAANVWMTYINAGGKPHPGLMKRRTIELDIFRKEKYPESKTRAQHKIAAENFTLKRWKAEWLEPSQRPTTKRQVNQAYVSYSEMTGSTLPPNVPGKSGIASFSSTKALS